jgi:hypothetical protein
MNPQTFYKLSIQGIVYLVDPVTSTAYTYDLKAPTAVGTVIWADPKAEPRIELNSDWKDTLAAKLTQASTAQSPS